MGILAYFNRHSILGNTLLLGGMAIAGGVATYVFKDDIDSLYDSALQLAQPRQSAPYQPGQSSETASVKPATQTSSGVDTNSINFQFYSVGAYQPKQPQFLDPNVALNFPLNPSLEGAIQLDISGVVQPSSVAKPVELTAELAKPLPKPMDLVPTYAGTQGRADYITVISVAEPDTKTSEMYWKGCKNGEPLLNKNNTVYVSPEGVSFVCDITKAPRTGVARADLETVVNETTPAETAELTIIPTPKCEDNKEPRYVGVFPNGQLECDISTELTFGGNGNGGVPDGRPSTPEGPSGPSGPTGGQTDNDVDHVGN